MRSSLWKGRSVVTLMKESVAGVGRERKKKKPLASRRSW